MWYIKIVKKRNRPTEDFGACNNLYSKEQHIVKSEIKLQKKIEIKVIFIIKKDLIKIFYIVLLLYLKLV